MTREEIENTPEVVDCLLDRFVLVDSRAKLRKRLEEVCDMAIKSLEQEDILNKIRAEIDKERFIDKDTRICKNALASGLEVSMQIIDKYRK